jgi:tetratricopeptide (TPR) repeat protein
MSAERFRDAVDAYRDATRSERGRGRDTRDRIRGTLVRRARRKRTTVAVGGALAMAFFATSAWAYTTGRLERWLEPAVEEPAPSVQPAEEHDRSVRRRERVAPVVDPEPIEEVEAPVVAEVPIAPAEPVREAPAREVVRRTPREVVVREEVRETQPPVAPPVETVEVAQVVEQPNEHTAAFRRAHEAHFGGGDPARAIELWNEYLELAPSGRLATEARYNRALARVRAGQYDIAIRELEPFANGNYGRYRREEATRLIEALRAR